MRRRITALVDSILHLTSLPPRHPTTFPPRLELKSCLSPAGDQLPGAVTNPLDGDQLTRISLDSRQPLYCLARRHGICGMSRVAGNPWDRDMMHTHQGYHNGDNIKNQQNHLSPYIYIYRRSKAPRSIKASIHPPRPYWGPTCTIANLVLQIRKVTLSVGSVETMVVHHPRQ